tara:strand:- start:2679 stop:3665 length:987 start_codon:yes stop_codon:yes gene_type:complete
MSIFIETLSKKQTNSTPIWLMRQAGRHLPEYRKIRSNYPNLMDMFLNSNEVANITLQPVERYNLDAAIIFSDILMVPYTLQASIMFNEGGKGPVVNIEFNKEQKIKKAEPVFNAIEKVKEKSNTPLIGFAGGPWTTVFYCLFNAEERRKNIQPLIKKNENKIDQLIEKFTNATTNYAIKQIDSGIDAFQLFESWAGILNDEQFDKWCMQPTREIFKEISSRKIPTIGFPRGASLHSYTQYSNLGGLSCISLDQNFNLKNIKKLNNKIAFQGNLNPETLALDKEEIVSEVKDILLAFKDRSHIFNLGHGVLPATPVENVKTMIDVVRKA